MENGADGGVAMASAFGFGGGRDGVVCEVFDASSGFSFGARIDGVDRPASSVARALSGWSLRASRMTRRSRLSKLRSSYERGSAKMAERENLPESEMAEVSAKS